MAIHWFNYPLSLNVAFAMVASIVALFTLINNSCLYFEESTLTRLATNILPIKSNIPVVSLLPRLYQHKVLWSAK